MPVRIKPKLTPINEEIFAPPDPMELQEPSPLFTEDNEVIPPRRMPRQCELQEFIDLVRKRAIRDYTIPLKAQDISQAQRNDPFFRDIYEFHNLGTLPSKTKRARLVKLLAEDYILYQGILFKITDRKDDRKFDLTLAIPEKCIPIIFHMYHDSLWSGHLGVKKTYQAIKDKYFCPNLFSKLQQYIKACTTCQEFKVPKATQETHDFIPRMLESHQPFRLNIHAIGLPLNIGEKSSLEKVSHTFSQLG